MFIAQLAETTGEKIFMSVLILIFMTACGVIAFKIYEAGLRAQELGLELTPFVLGVAGFVGMGLSTLLILERMWNPAYSHHD